MDHLPKKHMPIAAEASLRATKEDIRSFISASTLDIDWGEDVKDGDYRTLLRENKRVHYKSLA